MCFEPLYENLQEAEKYRYSKSPPSQQGLALASAPKEQDCRNTCKSDIDDEKQSKKSDGYAVGGQLERVTAAASHFCCSPCGLKGVLPRRGKGQEKRTSGQGVRITPGSIGCLASPYILRAAEPSKDGASPSIGVKNLQPLAPSMLVQPCAAQQDETQLNTSAADESLASDW